MKKIALLILFSAFSADVYAFELGRMSVSDIKKLPRPAVAAAGPAAAEKLHSQYIWLRIDHYTAGGAQAYDYSLKLDVVVRKTSAGYFYVDSKVGQAYDRGVIRVLNGDYRLSGDGMDLNLKKAGKNYALSGNVTGEDGRIQYLNLALRGKSDPFSYDISGYGLTLGADRSGISGTFDADRYSKKALSAAVSLLLALQLDAK